MHYTYHARAYLCLHTMSYLPPPVTPLPIPAAPCHIYKCVNYVHTYRRVNYDHTYQCVNCDHKVRYRLPRPQVDGGGLRTGCWPVLPCPEVGLEPGLLPGPKGLTPVVGVDLCDGGGQQQRWGTYTQPAAGFG
jgi:hypothetical protein